MKAFDVTKTRIRCETSAGALESYTCAPTENGFTFHGSDGKITDTVIFLRAGEGYVVTRRVTNESGEIVKLTELSARAAVCLGKDPAKDYFYANENARIYGSFTIPVDYDRAWLDNPANKKFAFQADTFWADPEAAGKRILSSPYQPFPAILLGNYEGKEGVVFGSLSQEVFYHNFEATHECGVLFVTIFSSFKGVAYRELQAGETLTDIWYIGKTETAEDINGIFDGYTKVLRTYLTDNEGAKDNNRHTLLWDSWNDGIYRDIGEEMLVNEAKAVKAHFPNVEWFQLDDGYSTYCEENVDLDAHGLGVAYEGDEGIDKVKFPNGLKGYTDKIKALGLRPAIWIGGFCPVKTKIYREKREWFIDYTYRVDWTQPLDVSKKEVRSYMTYALDKLVLEAGFEGVKHDFWSYAFEDKHDLLSNKEKSGYEWREWWHKELRKRVGDGYLETGCDVSMGNPFIGKYFNNYRFGLDIGAGNWRNVKTTMFWGVSVLANHTGDLFIPNSDSIGLLPGLNDRDFLFVVNFQVITRTLVEISGRFSKEDLNGERLAVLKRATKYLNNGEDVFFANFDYRKTGMNLPHIVYIKSLFDEEVSPENSRTVALFNAEEEEKEVAFSVEDLQLAKGEYLFEDVWAKETRKGDSLAIVLQPHESKLYKIVLQRA